MRRESWMLPSGERIGRTLTPRSTGRVPTSARGRNVGTAAILLALAAVALVVSAALLASVGDERQKEAQQPLVAPAADEAVPPPPPYYVLGYVYDAGGAVVPYSTVTITNVNTSVLVVVNSDNNGFYTYNLNDIPGGWEIGNIINVTAQKDLAIGWNESAAVEGPYLWIDVHMGFVIPEFPTLILPAAGMLAIFAAVQFRRRSEQA